MYTMISKWSVQIQKYREIWEVPIIRYNQLETQIEWWSDRCVYYRSISLAVSAELSSLSGSSCLLVNVNDISALANWLLSTAALSSSPVIATLSPHDNNTSRLTQSPHDNNNISRLTQSPHDNDNTSSRLIQSPHDNNNTIQYKICKAPCCRGFRGAGEQVS